MTEGMIKAMWELDCSRSHLSGVETDIQAAWAAEKKVVEAQLMADYQSAIAKISQERSWLEGLFGAHETSLRLLDPEGAAFNRRQAAIFAAHQKIAGKFMALLAVHKAADEALGALAEEIAK